MVPNAFTISLWACLCSHAGAATAQSDAGLAEVEGTARAKGIVLVRLSLPPVTSVGDISLYASRDGDTFDKVEMRVDGGPISSIVYEGDGTSIFVPVVGRFSADPPRFVLQEPGSYWLRWDINVEGGVAEKLTASQTIQVSPPSDADLRFLSRLSDPERMRALFCADFLKGTSPEFRSWAESRGGADYRALLVIKELLEASRSLEPLEGKHRSPEMFRKWTDTMFELFTESPDSTYSPYASLYAGGGYATYLCEAPEFKEARPGMVAVDQALMDRATQALRFSFERGDSYVRPRALCQWARLKARTTAWDEADRLLTQAEELTPGNGTVKKMIEDLRTSIGRSKDRRLQHEPDGK